MDPGLATYYSGEIKQISLDLVKACTGWLDDEAVDRYMDLVSKRRQSSPAGVAPTVGFLSAKFMPKLSEEESRSLEGWTQETQDDCGDCSHCIDKLGRKKLPQKCRHRLCHLDPTRERLGMPMTPSRGEPELSKEERETLLRRLPAVSTTGRLR